MNSRNYVNLVKAAAYGRAPEAGALPGVRHLNDVIGLIGKRGDIVAQYV